MCSAPRRFAKKARRLSVSANFAKFPATMALLGVLCALCGSRPLGLLPLLFILLHAREAAAQVANFEVVRGRRFAALADVPIASMPMPGTAPGQQSFVQLPPGWQVAANSDDSLLAVWVLPFANASGVVVADGSSWVPFGSGPRRFMRRREAAGGQLLALGSTFKPQGANQHILITAPVVKAGDAARDWVKTGPRPAQDPARVLTQNGIDYATSDFRLPSAPFNASDRCSDELYELDAEWDLAADDERTRVALLGASNDFESDSVLLASGSAVGTTTARVVLADDGSATRGFRRFTASGSAGGWWVVRPAEGCTGDAHQRVLIQRNSSSGASANSWVLREDGGAMREFGIGGMLDRFAVLSNTAVDSAAIGCDGVARAVPEGWALATPDTPNVGAAVDAGQWGTYFLVLADGSTREVFDHTQVGTAGGLVSFEGSTATYYAASRCQQRVLLHRRKLQSSWNYAISMQVLVLAVRASDVELPVLETALDAAQIPFVRLELDANAQCGYCQKLDLIDTAGNPKYSGVVATSDALITSVANASKSALSAAQWQELRDYMFNFNVRFFSASTQPAWRTTQGDRFGLTFRQRVFGSATITFLGNPGVDHYGLNPRSVFTLPPGAAQYQSVVDSSSGNTVTVVAAFGSGTYPAIVRIEYEDGREELHSLFDMAEWEEVAVASAAFWVPWLSRGLHLGQQRHHLEIGVHDIFASVTRYNGGPTFRLTRSDLEVFIDTVAKVNARLPAGSSIRPELGFRGSFSVAGDSLEKTVQDPQIRTAFRWLNQMYVGSTNWDAATPLARENDLRLNFQFADNTLFLNDPTLAGLSRTVMATPRAGLLGLTVGWDVANRFGVTAAFNDMESTAPNNTHILPDSSPYLGRITTASIHGVDGNLIIPRWVAHLYVDATDPAEQEAQWLALAGSPKSVESQITDNVDVWFRQLWAAHRPDPVTFSQGHLRVYDGINASLLGKWLDEFALHYMRYFVRPVISVGSDQLAKMYRDRWARKSCGLVARANVAGCQIRSITLTSSGTCTALVTGARSAPVADETYGSSYTLHVPMAPGSSVTITLSVPIDVTSCNASWIPLPPVTTGASTTSASGSAGGPTTDGGVISSDDASTSGDVGLIVLAVLLSCFAVIICGVGAWLWDRHRRNASEHSPAEEKCSSHVFDSEKGVQRANVSRTRTSPQDTRAPSVNPEHSATSENRDADCEQCGKAVRGKRIRLKTKTWHPDCFRCQECNTLLGAQSGGVKMRRDEVWCGSCVAARQAQTVSNDAKLKT
jgi:LIM domain